MNQAELFFPTKQTTNDGMCFLPASVPDGLKTFANLGLRGQIAPSRPRSNSIPSSWQSGVRRWNFNLNPAIIKQKNMFREVNQFDEPSTCDHVGKECTVCARSIDKPS